MDSSIFIFFNLLILFWLLSHIHSKSDDEKDDNDSLNSFNSPFTKYTEILITFIFILYLYLNNDNQFKLIHIQNLIDLTKLNSEIYLFLLNISVSNVLFPFSWIILVIFYMIVGYCRQVPGFHWYSIFDITSIILVIYYILNTLLLIPNTLSLIPNNKVLKVLSSLKLIVLAGLIGYTIKFKKEKFKKAFCDIL